MSILSIFTKRDPEINGVTFDAVLEDTLDLSVEVTSYPIESGVRISDHRILQPFKWSIVGAVTNNPLKTKLTDFLTGGLSNLMPNNPYVAMGAGLFAGWLAGSNDTRSSTTLQYLIGLMASGDPFTVSAGDITLKNMVITRISRTKDPENEGGLIFIADLQEVITLDRISVEDRATVDSTRSGDPSQTGIMGMVKKGQAAVAGASKAVAGAASKVLSGIF